MKLFTHTPLLPRRRSGRALIIQDGKILVFLRKRYSKISHTWIEYYSIPGGGIDPGETAEDAVVRELKEEMGVIIKLDQHVAHSVSNRYEHDVFTAHIVEGEPALVADSEEARFMTDENQFIVTWVDINELTESNLRYYANYLSLIRELAQGSRREAVLEMDQR